jgi:hypothetical protein
MRRKVLQPQESLKLFFDAMYAPTKELPPAAQKKIKRILFRAVLEVEDEVENWQTYAYSSLSSNVSLAGDTSSGPNFGCAGDGIRPAHFASKYSFK